MVKVAFSLALILIVGLLIFARRPASDSARPPASPSAPAAPPPAADAPSAAKASGQPDLEAMTAALVAAIPQQGSAKELFAATCAACHGPSGEGNATLKAPSIAGLPAWFSLIQFEKFRNGQRGEGDGDIGGQHMKTIAEAIDQSRLPELGEYIASLPVIPTSNDIGGDPVAGKTLFLEHCAGCHRYNAHGEKAFRSAPLSSLQDWYIFDTLVKYREEVRGYHSYDIDGIFMHRNLKYVSDEDFKHIIAYIAELAKTHPPGERRPRSRNQQDGSNAPVR